MNEKCFFQKKIKSNTENVTFPPPRFHNLPSPHLSPYHSYHPPIPIPIPKPTPNNPVIAISNPDLLAAAEVGKLVADVEVGRDDVVVLEDWVVVVLWDEEEEERGGGMPVRLAVRGWGKRRVEK